MFKRYSKARLALLLNLTLSLLFLVIAVAAVLLVNKHMRQQALAEAESKARLILDRNLATHTYFTHDLKPNLFEWVAPLASEGFFDPVWMSSTYAVREMDQYFKALNPTDYYYKEAAIDARSPENEADDYERAFIQELNADPEVVDRSLIRTLEGQPYFVTLRRGEAMEQACLRCHSTPDQAPANLVQKYGPERSFGREVGEVVSAISIRVPLSVAFEKANRFSAQLSGLLLALLCGLFVAQFWLNRRLVLTPLAAVRDKALQIANSSEHLGEEIPIPFGQELEELVGAFNTMSVNLRRSHDYLEQRVRERTAELLRSNVRLEKEIDERKRAKEALQESNHRLEEALAELETAQAQMVQQERLAAVGQLAAGIAHDFNNILASVVIYTELSLRAPELSPQLRERLEIIARQSDRAQTLVQQILDFGRRTILRREELDLAALLEETVTLLQRTLPESIRLEWESKTVSCYIDADPARVQQAIINLALNARDAMPQGGELRVGLDRLQIEPGQEAPLPEMEVGEWARVSVTDTGTGIPPEVLPHIFEPFFTTRAPVGSGLGLAQVHGIVAQHGGHVDVESQVGRGTTLSLYWPALPASSPATSAEEPPAPVQGGKAKILVAEDDPTTRAALAELLESLGYRVTTAADGREALAAFDDEVALVLSDLVMPRLGGVDLYARLKEKQPTIKMVVITGYPLKDRGQSLLQQGIDAWLQKPFSVEDIALIVQGALDKG